MTAQEDNMQPSRESEFVVTAGLGGSVPPALLRERGGGGTLVSAPGGRLAKGVPPKDGRKGDGCG